MKIHNPSKLSVGRHGAQGDPATGIRAPQETPPAVPFKYTEAEVLIKKDTKALFRVKGLQMRPDVLNELNRQVAAKLNLIADRPSRMALKDSALPISP